ncbi:LVIVD repeat-containing protein [Rufibacter quisquiliarum]|uniref:LVIVD repeat-containing protein n=1 Tax=Rufibacter quisquiliarum TaxID=1549639 RepID=A0A839GJK5_9BACT|nr:hypothetical protein [Rufibacter quisquiliarum]MBA9076949.1 hypothetical protein [Rufibacter quisquiliarum]
MKTNSFFFLFFAIAATVLFSCSQDSSTLSPSPAAGQGGSMARFAVSGDALYTVDQAKLHVYNITVPSSPHKEKEVQLGLGIETIFPFGDNLFIGSQTGMYIFDIRQQASPLLLSTYEHVTSCDPVVTDGRYAYLTLNAANLCRGVNELHVIDLQNLRAPSLVKRYPMQSPKGVGIDGNYLFVCDSGLKMYDASDVNHLQLKQHLNISAYDVIPHNGHLLVVGQDGLYQYAYTQGTLEQLSKISVQPSL